MYESINEQLKNNFYYNPTIRQMLPQMEQGVLSGQMTSFVAAARLLDNYYNIITQNHTT